LRKLGNTVPPVPGSLIDLSHNDYLGLRWDRKFQKQAHESGANSLIGGSASRLLGGQFSEFEELENAFAQFKQAESALYFSSGYSANESVITCLAHRNTAIFSDRLNHASIIDGIRLSPLPKSRIHIFNHIDMNDLEKKLQASTAETNLIITESLFSMDGDKAPLNRLNELATKYSGLLVVDEAHATGIYGKNGRGLLDEAGIGHDQLISINTCGKALGVQGALVCGPKWFKEYLINKARSFIYTTAPSPKIAAAVMVALNYVADLDDRRERLKYLSDFLRQELNELGYNTLNSNSHIIPVIVGGDQNAVKAAGHLAECGIQSFAIRPPTVPEGTGRIRISMHANLSEVDVAAIIEAFRTLKDLL